MAPENEVEISLEIRGGPNVVQVFGFCFDAPDGKPRIVMELCAHGSLRAHMKALPRDKVCERVVAVNGWIVDKRVRAPSLHRSPR